MHIFQYYIKVCNCVLVFDMKIQFTAYLLSDSPACSASLLNLWISPNSRTVIVPIEICCEFWGSRSWFVSVHHFAPFGIEFFFRCVPQVMKNTPSARSRHKHIVVSWILGVWVSTHHKWLKYTWTLNRDCVTNYLNVSNPIKFGKWCKILKNHEQTLSNVCPYLLEHIMQHLRLHLVHRTSKAMPDF